MSKTVKELEVTVDQLELGMRVVRLDRPWIETDFLMQGFIIQDQSDIDALVRQCDSVYIEAIYETVAKPERREAPKGLFARRRSAPPPVKVAVQPAGSLKKARVARPAAGEKVTYINKINTERELPAARNAYSSAKTVVKNIMEGIRIGRMLDMNQARETVDHIVDSILRSKDALAWLTKIKDKDEYTAEHSLNVCILSATFARHLGHDEKEIREIALCGLLHDVGKSKIPDEILNKEGRFTDEEFDLMRQHTTFGRNLLMSLPNADRIAIDVAHSHHERLDGNGYPRGLQAHQIPYNAKVIALTDSYDAITSSRCYDRARASMEALDIIYKCKGTQFDDELALEFIKCIGIYPPGSVVEFTNGEVGIIVSTDEKNKLRPRVIIVLDADKNPGRERIVDLNKGAVDDNQQQYIIAREIPNGQFGVDIRDYLKKGLVIQGQSKPLG
jgi:putative nucleotidyltransferase with HDIG domain